MSSFLHIARPTGAIMRTVATLSINAETAPEKSDMSMITHITLGHLSRMMSAIRLGIFDSIKKKTTNMVPPIIMRTFQLTTERMYIKSLRIIPRTTKAAATAQIVNNFHSDFTIITTYIRINSANATYFISKINPLQKNTKKETVDPLTSLLLHYNILFMACMSSGIFETTIFPVSSDLKPELLCSSV